MDQIKRFFLVVFLNGIFLSFVLLIVESTRLSPPAPKKAMRPLREFLAYV